MLRMVTRSLRLSTLLVLLTAVPVMAWIPPDYETFTTATHTTVAVAVTSTVALAAKSNRTFVILENISDTNIDCSIGATAVAGQGIRLYASGGSLLLDAKYPTAAINCIHGGSGTKSLLVTEGS
jgi:hypothetical protein